MKKLLFLISFLIICYTFVFAQDSIVKETQINKVILKMYENLGKFEGYLIFYDKNGKQCAVEFISTTYLQDGNKFFVYPHIDVLYRNNIIYEKKLEIAPDKFQYLTLRNGEEIFAYPIEIFFLDVPKHNPAFSEIINTISFEFRSNKLMAQDEIRLFPER